MATQWVDCARVTARALQETKVRWLAALMAGTALSLVACHGGGGSGQSTATTGTATAAPVTPTPTPTPTPGPVTPTPTPGPVTPTPGPANPAMPSALSYPTPGAIVVGTAIAPLTPSVSGTVASYSVSPALPTGLTLNAATGVISGTPVAATPNTGYVVQATNSSGSGTYTLQFAVGTVDVLSGSTITRTAVAGTSVYFYVVIMPRYMSFIGTLYSKASDPDGELAAPVAVTGNADGSFTLEVATSTTASAAAYAGTAKLQLCSDSDCATPQPVPSVSANYSIQIMDVHSNWPGNHLTTLTPWSGVADWQTFQGNSAHTGFVPVTISPDQLVTRWQQSVTPNVHFNGVIGTCAAAAAANVPCSYPGENLATVTTSNGLFYIVDGSYTLQARRESDASLVWSSSDFDNPPAVSNGVVYVAAGTYIFAFDAATGALIYQSPISSQEDDIHDHLAPTIGADGMYVDAGVNGGIYGFTTTGQFTPTGPQLFFTSLPNAPSASTPAVDSTAVYAYTGNALTLLDPISGQIKGTIVDPTFTNQLPVIGGSVVLGASHSAFAADYDNVHADFGGNYLLHFNTSSLTIDWKVQGNYPQTPAYNAGVVYAVNNNPLQLEARAEADGSLLWSWHPAETSNVTFKSEVLLTNNLAFVSTNWFTYAIDLTTHKAVWSYPVSGNLALSSNGVLYLEGYSRLTAINAK